MAVVWRMMWVVMVLVLMEGMAHEGSQSGQMGVQVFAFPVPLEQSMVGKGVAKVVQPRA